MFDYISNSATTYYVQSINIKQVLQWSDIFKTHHLLTHYNLYLFDQQDDIAKDIKQSNMKCILIDNMLFKYG